MSAGSFACRRTGLSSDTMLETKSEKLAAGPGEPAQALPATQGTCCVTSGKALDLSEPRFCFGKLELPFPGRVA